jgi:lactose/L-arabinose transport system ATP-binding protein
MSDLLISSVRKSYGDTEIIKGVDLDIKDGEFIVVVGPSGCGKSTLLRMIAGLETVTEGDMSIGGNIVTDEEPYDRGIAMVFQSYALYPHMTVADNMAFALKLQGVSKAERRKVVEKAAAVLQIEALLDRRPAQLSGGQRQRVAIGRAIVREPEVFLFDEPLSNLDAELRVQMRIEIARLHKKLGATMVYVTHDQTEAMTMADRIVILRGGVVEQVGSPAHLYEDPDNMFVAGFIGSPKMNFIPCIATGAQQVELAGKTIDLPQLASSLTVGETYNLGVRPEHMQEDTGTDISLTVDVAEGLGSMAYAYGYLEGDTTGPQITVELPKQGPPASDEKINVRLDAPLLYIFEIDGARVR